MMHNVHSEAIAGLVAGLAGTDLAQSPGRNTSYFQ